jgi:hypothetical protein
MKKVMKLYIFGTIVFVFGCGLKDKIEKQNKAKANADFIMENLNNVDVINQFPEKYFPPNQVKPVLDALNKNCDLDSKRGKFVDFFTMMNDGKSRVAFIYEYFLKCDSLRFIYMYDLESKDPTLYKFNIEPLEQKNTMIIDPSKQLLYSGAK